MLHISKYKTVSILFLSVILSFHGACSSIYWLAKLIQDQISIKTLWNSKFSLINSLHLFLRFSNLFIYWLSNSFISKYWGTLAEQFLLIKDKTLCDRLP